MSGFRAARLRPAAGRVARVGGRAAGAKIALPGAGRNSPTAAQKPRSSGRNGVLVGDMVSGEAAMFDRKTCRRIALAAGLAGLTAAQAYGQLDGLMQRALSAGGVAATAPARPVAVVTAGTASLPAGTQLYVGQSFEVGSDQVTLAYLSPCAIETVRGGSVTVAPFGSVVSGGTLASGGTSCTPGRL